MTTARERYSELLSLTQLYLMQEYSHSEKIFSGKDSYDYFRAFAAQRQATAKKQSTLKPAPLLSAAPATPQQQPVITSPAPPAGEKPIDFPPSIETNNTPLSPPPATAAVETESKEKEEVVGVKTQVSTPPPFRFTLTPQVPAVNVPLDDLRKITSEHLPHLKLLDLVPDDNTAREIARAWEKGATVPQAAILSFNEQGAHEVFLRHIALAAEMMGLVAAVIPAAKIESKKGWEAFLSNPHLKCVIGSGNGISSLPGLDKFRKESAKSGTTLLLTRPLLTLSDISFYIQEPSLKRSLWKSLKDHLSRAAKADEQ